MHRFCLLLLLLAGLLPSLASAQTNMGLNVYYDGELYENSDNQLILTTQQCNADISIKFDILLNQTAVDPNDLLNSKLELWRGPGSCKANDQRQDPNGNNCSEATCDLVDSRTIMSTGNLSMTASAKELFADDDGTCDTGNYTVTLVVVEAQSCGEARDDQLPSDFSATFELRGPPSPPTNVKVSSGNSSLGVSWKAPDTRTTNDYRLYVDTDPGPDCANELLEAGMTPSEANMLAMMDEVRTFRTEKKSFSLSTSNLGLDVGDSAAVYVATIDTQANDFQSTLSAMACGERILTEGPLGAVEAETGKSIQTCSGGEQRSKAASSAAVLMGLLGLWLVRRRENRA